MIDLGGKSDDPKMEPVVRSTPSSGAAGASGPSVSPPSGEPPATPPMPEVPSVGEPTLKDVMEALKEIKEALARIEAKSGG